MHEKQVCDCEKDCGDREITKNGKFDTNINTPYTCGMLNAPKEPKHVKDWMESVEQNIVKTPGINWDSLNVWYGNQLPKYLWAEWKDELKPRGLTWQKFLKLLRQRTDAVLMWHKGLCTWDHFVEEIVKLIDGPLGQDIARK